MADIVCHALPTFQWLYTVCCAPTAMTSYICYHTNADLSNVLLRPLAECHLNDITLTSMYRHSFLLWVINDVIYIGTWKTVLPRSINFSTTLEIFFFVFLLWTSDFLKYLFSSQSIPYCKQLALVCDSDTTITVRHHEACRVKPYIDQEWLTFLSAPYTHDKCFCSSTSNQAYSLYVPVQRPLEWIYPLLQPHVVVLHAAFGTQ